MFFIAYDLGNGNPADAFLEGKVPFDAPAGLSIQEIVVLAGVPPISVGRQVVTGDLIEFPSKRATATAQVANGLLVGIQVTDGGFG